MQNKREKLYKRIDTILRDNSFNELPYEKRQEICKYLTQHQILTLWQAIKNYPTLVCDAYRGKIMDWLNNIVADYEMEYGEQEADHDV